VKRRYGPGRERDLVTIAAAVVGSAAAAQVIPVYTHGHGGKLCAHKHEIPALAGSETYYGVTLSDVGDDGDVVILGHGHDPMRLIAALNRHAREYWGFVNLLDDKSMTVADLAGDFSETWAYLTADNTDEYGWYMEWNVNPLMPNGSFPVTMWRP
jgi:hypothetical protein